MYVHGTGVDIPLRDFAKYFLASKKTITRLTWASDRFTQNLIHYSVQRLVVPVRKPCTQTIVRDRNNGGIHLQDSKRNPTAMSNCTIQRRYFWKHWRSLHKRNSPMLWLRFSLTPRPRTLSLFLSPTWTHAKQFNVYKTAVCAMSSERSPLKDTEGLQFCPKSLK